MNKRKLAALMAEYGDTQKTLSSSIGVSLSRFNAKLNETGGAEFGQTEITNISKRYNLSPERIAEIFFDSAVS